MNRVAKPDTHVHVHCVYRAYVHSTGKQFEYSKTPEKYRDLGRYMFLHSELNALSSNALKPEKGMVCWGRTGRGVPVGLVVSTIVRILSVSRGLILVVSWQVSLCNYSLTELSNPGASGSIFYISDDDEFIVKTVQHKEADFLQKLLPGYYMVQPRSFYHYILCATSRALCMMWPIAIDVSM